MFFSALIIFANFKFIFTPDFIKYFYFFAPKDKKKSYRQVIFSPVL